MKETLGAILRTCFAFGTWGQRVRTTALCFVLALVAFWAWGVLSVHFYRPPTVITLSGKTQTQCVGRYLIDVPVELGRMGSNRTVLTYGLDTDFDTVEMDVKSPDYTAMAFHQEVQARLDDIKEERTDWGAPTLLAQEVIDTKFGKALLLRFLTHGFKESGLTHELHILVGTRYAILKGKSYVPDPEPVSSEPLYKFINPAIQEDRMRKIALNLQGYTDATKAPEGFCVAGVVLNDKTMGYDIERGYFEAEARAMLGEVRLSLYMQGQYANTNEETVFDRVDRVNPRLRAGLASGGGQLVGLRRSTLKINGLPAREYGDAMHLRGTVVFHLMAESALPKEEQSLARPFFTFNFEAGSAMGQDTSPLDENQVLAIWDTVLGTMRLSPANGGNRIDPTTGGLTPMVKVGQACPRSGIWEASLLDNKADRERPELQRLLRTYYGRFKPVQQGHSMPPMYVAIHPSEAPKLDMRNAEVVWTWIREA